MQMQIPTWAKSGSIFLGIATLLSGILWITDRDTKDISSDTFVETRRALNRLLEENFSESGTITVPTIDPDADWLNDSGDDPFLGPVDAELVIMEFGDFQCPYCKASFPAIREIVSKHANVKYIFRDWPVDDLHPEARIAAEAAGCAHDQDKFWAYHDRLFQNQHNLSRTNLFTYARQTGLDMREFTECFDRGKYAAEVEQDRLIGVRLGVRGTPTWFINGEKIEGAISEEGWEDLFNAL